MAQKLEAIRGGGGSIKVGTTGTISALMSRELESAKSASPVPSTCSSSVSTLTGNATPRRLKPGTSADEASSSSGTGSFRNRKDPENLRKHQRGGTPQIPMLTAYDTSVDGAPIRKRPVKKGYGVVEIVDIKCGIPDKIWVNPITHRLKKLSFSKFSDSNV